MTENSAQQEVQPPALRKIDNLIAVASGKGGVGKTFVSATLSHSLAREGKRVLLFDGDLGLANVDVQLGLMPAHDLGSVVSGEIELEKAIATYPLSDAKADTNGTFDILAGKSSSGASASRSWISESGGRSSSRFKPK